MPHAVSTLMLPPMHAMYDDIITGYVIGETLKKLIILDR